MSLVILSCLAETMPAHAAETGGAAAAAAPSPAQDESGRDEIIVTGYGQSLREATETKRKADYGVDSINSTDIGKFPAQNVAEALQLIPGVAITRPRGEGLYVSVRGLGPQFQSTLLNDSPVALNDLIENGGLAGRQFRFEMLPAEFTSSIDVVKTPTADMTEGALGGNIGVRTFRPFDVGTKTTLNLRGTYTTQTEKVKPNGTIITSYVNKSGTFGVLLGGQYWGKSVRNDRFMNFGWNLNKFTSAAAGGLPAGLYTPTRTRPTIETEDRKRISGLLSLQWRPTSELETTLDVLATRLDVAYDEFGLDIYPDDPNTVIDASTAKIEGNTVVAATIRNVRFMASREYSLNRHDLIDIGLHQKWDHDRWHLSGNVNWSYAHSFHPSYDVGTVRSRAMYLGTLTYDASQGYKTLPTITSSIDPTNPANYTLYQFNIAPKDSKDWDFFTRVDAAYDMGGFFTKVAVGADYHWRKRDYFRRDFIVNPAANTSLTSLGTGAYEALPYDDFLSNVSGNIPRDWVAPVTQAYLDAFFTSSVANSPLTASDLRASFVVSEKTWSAYARADYAFSLGAIPITGNIGARYVHTDQVASGTLTTGSTPTPVSYPKTFKDVLPSFNLRAELTHDLIGRLAASRVLTRPNVTDSAPRISVSTDAPTASGGNPELVPFLATQFDGSLEWYFNRSGSLTGAVFYKAMDNYITQQNVYITVPSKTVPVLLSTQVNGGDAKVYGIEAAYYQIFTFLPEPFDGLGLQASYTHVWVKADYTAGARPIRDQLIGLSKNSYNIVGFYDKGPISARLSYVWRGRYLSGTGSTTQASTYTAPFGSLDGSLAYRITPSITASVEGINLSGAHLYTYNDDQLRFGEINYYGRTFLFGVRAEF